MSDNNKISYQNLCEEKKIPLFMQAWWMDAVCGRENWDVILSIRNNKIVGALPYHLIKKMVFKLILQPQLTQYNGMWIEVPLIVDEERRIFENEIQLDLLFQLERKSVHYYNQSYQYNFQYVGVLKKNDYKIKSRYTYVIEDISRPDQVFKSFSHAKQKHIRKSEHDLRVRYDISPDEFYDYHQKSLLQRGNKISYSKALFLSICAACFERRCGQIFGINDSEGNLHAAIFVVWDKQSAYDLISAIDINFKSSGASTLVVWEAIKYLSDKTAVFDFEGSMIESVANSFKQFGTVRKTYFNASKYYTKIFKPLLQIRLKE
jgi:lipid II:glycine glycyltransferase (peptidoglycan interpeptide bridge formation enzyme)